MHPDEIKELRSTYKWFCNNCYGHPKPAGEGCYTNDRRQKGFSCHELGKSEGSGWEGQKPDWKLTKEIKDGLS